jgi:hypothetical protein
MKIASILDQIDLHNYALPVFQRGYVWNREQVRKLMVSLYKGHPIGSLLVWVTKTISDEVKGNQPVSKGFVHLILDGQQRITTLYGIIRGKVPPFFEGDERTFKDLYFNVDEQSFEFYQAAKMKNDPNWINVTNLMIKGAGEFVAENFHHVKNINKLNSISNILSVDLPIQEVSGDDKTIDVVVDIFNTVNSGGTKLSKGDLALAKICADWHGARDEFKTILDWLEKNGYEFSMDWLLRCITVYLTNQPYFTGLERISVTDIKKALPQIKSTIESILNQIGSRLGLDQKRVLPGVFAFPVIIQLLKNTKKTDQDNKFWNKIFYWYIHTFLWGRYSGSTESVLAKDLNELNAGEGIDGLISLLRKDRGDLRIQPEDFIGWSTGSRFYPLLYMMTRIGHSLDWYSGLELTNALLGKHSSLEVHHIFPKDLLYKKGYEKSEVNSLANYSFLTKGANLWISNKNPNDYFPIVNKQQPNALKTHWIPQDPTLSDPNNYLKFLEERRILLAKAANKLLNNLLNSDEAGRIDIRVDHATAEEPSEKVKILDPNEEDDIILGVASWMEENGFPEGELQYNIVADNGKVIAIFDLAWPKGIQVGLSEPVALLINESMNVHQIASRAGYKYFTDADDFKQFVRSTYMGEA